MRDEIETLKPMQTLGETEYRELDRSTARAPGGRLFGAGMGAEAVRDIIARMDLEELARAPRRGPDSSGQRRKKATKRLRLIEALRRSGNRPEWMILRCCRSSRPTCGRWSSWTAAASRPPT